MMFVDAVLYRLTDPERQRRRAEIVKAVDRVCEVIEKAKGACRPLFEPPIATLHSPARAPIGETPTCSTSAPR